MTKRDTSPDAEAEAYWARQEHLRKAQLRGEPIPGIDRILFAALTRESIAEPPDDFAATTAAAVERLADARRRVERFRSVSLRLFCLLYLPIMTLCAVLSGVGAFSAMRLWPDAHAHLLWAGMIVALWLMSEVIHRIRSHAAR
jgi:hypothetical protein